MQRKTSWWLAVALMSAVAACSGSANTSAHNPGGPGAGQSGAGTGASTDTVNKSPGAAGSSSQRGTTGGTAGQNGASGANGAAGTSGAAGSGGSSGSAGSGAPGACDPGSTTTTWASNCATSTPACMPGTWTAPGSTTNDPLGYESDHFAFYWPSGNDYLSNAQAAANVLENTIWKRFMGSPMFFPEPYCSSTAKHKVSIVIHSDSGLTGGGWGNGYMGMWIGPGATADHWGLAHEFTHALQASTGGMANSKYTGWIWESHANWHAHQLDEYHDSNVHCSELLVNFPHLYLGSTRDRYCNWQFMEYFKDKYCYAAVEDIFAKAPKSGSAQAAADPFSVMQANMGWSIAELNDFFGEWAMHNVAWDYENPDGSDQGAVYRKQYGATSDRSGHAQGAPEGFRRLRNTQLDPLDLPSHRFVTPSSWAPQRFGYNLVRLFPDAGATSVTLTFRGVLQDGAANSDFGSFSNQPASIPSPSPDFRWGLVAVDASGGKPRYGALQHGTDGQVSFCLDPSDAQLWLVVMATPSVMQQILWDQMYYTVYRYPWMIELQGAMPDGFQPNAPSPSASGSRFANGGGWVASGANVAASAYVGPYAAVLGGTVSGTARIDDHAIVVSGTVSGSAVVNALTVLSGGIDIGGNARVGTVFQGPGTFESGQSVSGTGQVLGDVELRGQGMAVTKGVFYGFIDSSVTSDGAQGANRTAPAVEVTAQGPYIWRP